MGAARQGAIAPLVVRVLDVGQGDAILIENGGSRVLVDGGPEESVLARKLDELGVRDTVLDVVILTHEHADHSNGLKAVFERERQLRVRYYFDNRDARPGHALAQLRDSVLARVRRGELVWRDTDDPCGDGRSMCTIALRGGARLRILRPEPSAQDAPGGGGAAAASAPASDQNDRSVALKLVGPDSAGFTMWLAGDAERRELAWFEAAGYTRDPGLRVDVLKADHHGSCNGASERYLALTQPKVVVVSVGAENTYGHMHEQTKALLRARGIPWYRTDADGDIVIRAPGTPGSHYSVTTAHGAPDANGPSDRWSKAAECR